MAGTNEVINILTTFGKRNFIQIFGNAIRIAGIKQTNTIIKTQIPDMAPIPAHLIYENTITNNDKNQSAIRSATTYRNILIKKPL